MRIYKAFLWRYNGNGVEHNQDLTKSQMVVSFSHDKT